MNKAVFYAFVICFALSILTNIILGFVYYGYVYNNVDKASSDYRGVEIAFLLVNALMILLTSAFVGSIFYFDICDEYF